MNTAEHCFFPIFYADLAISLMNGNTEQINAYLKAASLAPEDLLKANHYMSTPQFLVTMHTCLQHVSPHQPAALQLLKHLPLTAHGTLGLALITAPTISDALDIGIKYFSFVLPNFVLHREKIGKETHVFIKQQLKFGSPCDETLMELVVASFARIAEYSVLKSSKRPRRLKVHFSHAAQYADTTAYDSFFGMPVSFSSPHSCFIIQNKITQQVLASHHRITHNSLIATLNQQLQQSPNSQSLSDRVKYILLQELVHGQALNASSIAGIFSMSTRSLSRHLSNEQTSLSALITQVRVERAQWILSNDNVPLAKVAAIVGFGSQSAFTRAFRLHYGKTPGELRLSFKYNNADN